MYVVNETYYHIIIFGPFLFQHYRLHTFCFYTPKGLSRSLFSFMLWFDSKANKDSIWSDGSHLLEQCCVRTKHSFTLLLLLEKCQGRESQGTLFCAECTYFADFQFSFKVYRHLHLIKSINLQSICIKVHKYLRLSNQFIFCLLVHDCSQNKGIIKSLVRT